MFSCYRYTLVSPFKEAEAKIQGTRALRPLISIRVEALWVGCLNYCCLPRIVIFQIGQSGISLTYPLLKKFNLSMPGVLPGRLLSFT